VTTIQKAVYTQKSCLPRNQSQNLPKKLYLVLFGSSQTSFTGTQQPNSASRELRIGMSQQPTSALSYDRNNTSTVNPSPLQGILLELQKDT